MDEYKDKIRNMCWSYSRLTSFVQCKYDFYLNYIVNDKEKYPSESNFWAETGSFVHKILEKFFKGELTIDEAPRYYVDNFNENVLQKTSKATMDKTFELCADYFCQVDFDWLKDYEILGIESETKFKIEDYDFVGYIDLLLRDKNDGKIVIVDHKSSEYPLKLDGKVKANSKELYLKYKRQLYLYSYYVYQKYNEYPKLLCWNHFKNGRMNTIPFKKNEFQEAIRWVLKVIHTIEKEIKFEPTLQYFYCKNLCGFRNVCEYNKDAFKCTKKWKKYTNTRRNV